VNLPRVLILVSLFAAGPLLIFSVLSQGETPSPNSDLQVAYETEQFAIESELHAVSLAGAKQGAMARRTAIKQWMQQNRVRLEEQVQRAAYLDQVDSLPADPELPLGSLTSTSAALAAELREYHTQIAGATAVERRTHLKAWMASHDSELAAARAELPEPLVESAGERLPFSKPAIDPQSPQSVRDYDDALFQIAKAAEQRGYFGKDLTPQERRVIMKQAEADHATALQKAREALHKDLSSDLTETQTLVTPTNETNN